MWEWESGLCCSPKNNLHPFRRLLYIIHPPPTCYTPSPFGFFVPELLTHSISKWAKVFFMTSIIHINTTFIILEGFTIRKYYCDMLEFSCAESVVSWFLEILISLSMYESKLERCELNRITPCKYQITKEILSPFSSLNVSKCEAKIWYNFWQRFHLIFMCNSFYNVIKGNENYLLC